MGEILVLNQTLSRDYLYIPNSIKGCLDNWSLAISHLSFGHTEQCNDLLERPSNNRFPMYNYQCPLSNPLLNQLYITKA